MNNFKIDVLERLSTKMAKYLDQNCFCIKDKYYTYRELSILTAKIQQEIRNQYTETTPVGLIPMLLSWLCGMKDWLMFPCIPCNLLLDVLTLSNK